ncbi:MAG: hypothetical protein C0410_12440 [Anaerolinea sp.]|nr:hypothetical protein [Anaerolinea sp.]
MKKFLPGFLLLLFLLSMQIIIPTKVSAENNLIVENPIRALCIPGDADLFIAKDCSVDGPAKRLDDLAKVGITFPPVPFPGINPPVELNNIPFSYAKVTNDEVPLYATIEDAIAGNPTGKLAASRIKYVSLIQKVSTEKGIFYQTSTSKWISAEVITKVGVQSFQGLAFKRNPTLPFGWILTETTSRKGPGIEFEEIGKEYKRFDVINIYDSNNKDTEWVMVGPNEWIDHHAVGRVTPNYTLPPGVESDRWIEVNLYEQVLIVHEKDRIVFATLISSGVDPFFTQPGVFKIYKRLENQYMQGAFEADRSDYYYLEDVPFIQYYDQARALHGAYWNTLFGYQRSHGCVNLSVADAHWVFDWAKDGDYVYVWDPSGKTPTDPSFYGAGGA